MQRNSILPGSTIGILGGGQLGRMMATAAKHMGYRIAVLDPTPDCPAAQVADRHIEAAYDDMEAVKQLATCSDVVTYEFENVDLEAARYLEKQGLLPQGAHSLEVTQDREQEKQAMAQDGLPVPEFAIVTTEQELREAVYRIGYPCVVKTCRGGYDGKGQMMVQDGADIDEAVVFLEKANRCIVEQFVAFEKEISIVFTRSVSGEITFFPLAENEHSNHILHRTIAPARVNEKVKEKAVSAAETVAERLDLVGTFAIEMFVKQDDIYLNEMAPRPHNSGHYTIEACNVSQFEQHIRAICGLPLIPVLFHGSAEMINLLGEDIDGLLEDGSAFANAHVHIYGKDGVKPNRKMGHITIVGEKAEDLILLREKRAAMSGGSTK
ncbi:5-(carboxyamino)imidazole ribonucleotide synthase [Sediminibacillus massiliensis]|uniref:5-(carboxyamino)imidazole ribonucleotide synthase n=1 Tax=Sediminibacillus massiliensis TaxID=1926277 RepID=UPI00098841D2|nr:5-(carboxyamino)imidazole ribonucleotide synthase [Sediminibacillus massiliensis]